MVSQQEIRRRSSAADRTSPLHESMTPEATVATSTTFSPPSDLARAHSRTQTQHIDTVRAEDATRRLHKSSGSDADMMPPPPIPSDSGAGACLSRSNSAASRITNRLSLTLPIAPPTSDPSRPAHRSGAGTPSIPPTPAEQSTVASPPDANEFIIAIAAQERRVLELREELARAEADLSSLKKQWTTTGSYHKRPVGHHHHHPDTPRKATPGASLDDDNAPSRRSVDLDRRKTLLQNQGQSTPTQNRRRVIRGGHTRTLSLLSPAKPPSEFSVLEDGGVEEPKVPPMTRTATMPSSPALSKRSSWQPRSTNDSPMMPWLVEDFKLGLKAFVEDIRQITVGDEPITGHANRTTPTMQNGSAGKRSSGGLERRATVQSSRPRAGLGLGLDTPSSGASTPTPSGRHTASAALEKPKPIKNKRFSWTPLGFDAVDDSDWANWDSPGPSKSPRWSGSTINSAGLEEIASIPEAGEEKSTPVKNRSITGEAPLLSPQKLEEILPSVVNRLSPSNLKRTANSLMDEWEKSLVAPGAGDKENEA
ncbi:hypothetical protein VFPBJ_07814 [Purpureocillium lilacinum]|uniref:DUF4048 domain-containing protein n=1 Tax=Purpureocillium lilacinum TaxID=33203 RepID=A0A179GHN2_PURLI|nr:hypothetical protein VFPBJ_07814 [Purpureocillium lilacinum]